MLFSSRRLHKTVHHLLRPRLFKLDAELVAFDLGDGAIAEFEVEDAFAHGKGGAVVAEVDGTGDEVALDGQRAAALATGLVGAGALPAGGFIDAFERVGLY